MLPHPIPSCILPNLTLPTLQYEARGGGKGGELSDKGCAKDRVVWGESGIVRKGLMKGRMMCMIVVECDEIGLIVVIYG